MPQPPPASVPRFRRLRPQRGHLPSLPDSITPSDHPRKVDDALVNSKHINDPVKGTRKTRPRRRGRRAGSGNKSKPRLSLAPVGTGEQNVASGSSQDVPPSPSSTASNSPCPEGTVTDHHCHDGDESTFSPFEIIENPTHTPALADFHDTREFPSPTPATRTPEWPSAPSVRSSRRPAYIGSHLPIATVNLPETKPFSLATPDFGGAEFTMPTPYNSDFPHPLTAYASPGVNPASASGYAPHLRELQETDSRATMGAILADCGNENMTAPALSLTPGNKDGCGIPEKLWLQLSACAGVKVPIGAVLPAVMAGRGVSPRFLQATPPTSPTRADQPSLVSPRSSDFPESPVFSTFSQSRRLSSRSETDLQRILASDYDLPRLPRGPTISQRRGSLPELHLSLSSRTNVRESPRHYGSVSITENELLRETQPYRLAADRTSEPTTPPTPCRPRLPSRRMSSTCLSTVEETDDIPHSKPPPIGSERRPLGHLPTLSLSQTSTRRLPPPALHSSASSSFGGLSSRVSPIEGSFALVTPPAGSEIFTDEPLPRHHTSLLSHDHEAGLLPWESDEWHGRSVASSTTLDFSTGKSIWS